MSLKLCGDPTRWNCAANSHSVIAKLDIYPEQQEDAPVAKQITSTAVNRIGRLIFCLLVLHDVIYVLSLVKMCVWLIIFLYCKSKLESSTSCVVVEHNGTWLGFHPEHTVPTSRLLSLCMLWCSNGINMRGLLMMKMSAI